MYEISGSALEAEIAYRRERLQGAAGAGVWKRSGELWSRRTRFGAGRRHRGRRI